MQLPGALLCPSPKKKKKIQPEKNSLYFEKCNFLALILKNFTFFYISGNGNPEKISYIFSKESFYISGNGNSQKFLIFQERTS